MRSDPGISSAAPSLRYYRAVEGHWRAAWVVSVRSSRARALFELVIETSVDASSRADQGEVIHTTKISKWGVTLYEAIETLALDPNGKDVLISRRQRFAPSPFFTVERGRSRAEVDSSGTRARYWFPLLAGELLQTVTIEAAGRVRVVQQTQYLQSEALLERIHA